MPAAPQRPRLAVWKLASCDGCQLTVLDLQDELLSLAAEVDIAHFTEATSTDLPGPYDISLVEGSVTTPADAENIRRIRAESRTLVTIGACATAGGIQALRNFGDVAEFAAAVYARPEYIDALATSTAVAEHVTVDFELRGCPIDKRQLIDAAVGAAGGPAAEAVRPQRLPRVQAARHDLRHGGTRDAVPRPGDAGWLRRHLPRTRTRLLRVLRTDGHAPHRRARSAAGPPRHVGRRPAPGVQHLQCGG